MDFDRKRSFQIGHFRVPKTLTFKVRPSAQPFLWKWVLFAWVWKIISISKAGHLYSFWYRGPGEPGNGLFATLEARGKLGRVNFGKDFWERYYGQAGGGEGGEFDQQLSGASPVTIPGTIAGRISAPVAFSYLKRWLPNSWCRYFTIFIPILPFLDTSEDGLFVECWRSQRLR